MFSIPEFHTRPVCMTGYLPAFTAYNIDVPVCLVTPCVHVRRYPQTHHMAYHSVDTPEVANGIESSSSTSSSTDEILLAAACLVAMSSRRRQRRLIRCGKCYGCRYRCRVWEESCINCANSKRHKACKRRAPCEGFDYVTNIKI